MPNCSNRSFRHHRALRLEGAFERIGPIGYGTQHPVRRPWFENGLEIGQLRRRGADGTVRTLK